jgi:hypothetical protein
MRRQGLGHVTRLAEDSAGFHDMQATAAIARREGYSALTGRFQAPEQQRQHGVDPR